VTWRDVNVLEELDYAVQLGVLTPPSMAIDGELVFAKLPTRAQLRENWCDDSGVNGRDLADRIRNLARCGIAAG